MFAPDAVALWIRIVFPLYLKSCEWRLGVCSPLCECCMLFFSYCCHSTVAHSDWSMKPPLSLYSLFFSLSSLSLAICVFGWRLAYGLVGSRTTSQELKAGCSVLRSTISQLYILKKKKTCSFFFCCQLHPLSGRFFFCRMSGSDWCFF